MAAAVSGAQENDNRSSEWARKYPPLAALAVALLLALAVLPSSLNLPQSNPTQTLEFAPVPPEDDSPPPDTGNLSSLGLASSGNLEQGGAPGGDDGGPGLPPPDAPVGLGKSPRTKRCVGNPPRQTEDPLAPPCVADFRGDNFGRTYQGVTAEEVRVLIYVQGFTRYVNTCSDPNQVTPDGEYFDLAQPPEPGEHCVVRALRVWQQYFNERYQTYNRFVHFWVYFSGQGDSSEERKADAAENFERVRPFAVLTLAVDDFLDDYMEAMAKRGVLVFDAATGRRADFFRKYPKLIWGYQPSVEQQAKMFAGFICTKVAGQPVVDSGNAGVNGQPRKYGLVYSADPGTPDLRFFKDIVKDEVSGCGVEFAAEATFPSAGYVADTRYPPTYAQRAMANFQSQGITTIIWPGGLETNMSKSAAQINYLPEWIVAGDLTIETDTSGTFQDQTAWDHAWVVTTVVAILDDRKTPCYVAYRETDPEADDVEVRTTGCVIYPSLRQLFTGIQVAGPKLTPDTIDQGYHAIPAVRSPDPSIPACFYEPGDYTCVKDAMAMHWDRTGDDDGCWRMMQNGLRYFASVWPEGNLDAQATADDVCSDYDGSFLVNQNPPSPDNL